jgi:hypothetical protein
MANARDGVLPDSWGANSAEDISACNSNTVSSFTGSYDTATATFPGTVVNVVTSSTGTVSSASNAKRAVKIGGPAWLKREL